MKSGVPPSVSRQKINITNYNFTSTKLFMKKLAYILLAGTCIFTSCQKQGSSSTGSEAPTASDSLRVALANQDSLLVLMNDMAEGMAQIKQIENILSSSDNLSAESRNQRTQLRNDMQTILQTLQERRDRLAELEKKLQNSSANNTTLQKSIQTLKQQIADQENTINALRNDLANANIHIERLTANVDSLSNEIANVAAEKAEVEQEANFLGNELNTCYYAIGSKKELKEHKLIETGFLRKTKILPEDFEHSYFTRADKRTLTTIDLHAKKGKVLSNQPSDSYTISEAPNGSKVLRITNSDRFWSISNFLVIEVN